MSDFLIPGQTIGIIGGNHLARTLALSAKLIGFQIGVMAPLEDSPAFEIADWHIVAEFNDKKALQQMIEKCDVITYETETVEVEALNAVEGLISFPQGSDLLAITQDRLLEKAFLDNNFINIAPYATIVQLADIELAVDSIGFPCILKTTDSTLTSPNQHIMHSFADIRGCLPLLKSGTCILEANIPYEKELSIMIASNGKNEFSIFPIVENIYNGTVLEKTIAPADIGRDVMKEARRIARQLATSVRLRGILHIEMFVTATGAIYVNALNPRPHLSGYYSLDACSLSQFEAHIRGICGWPMPEVKLLSPIVVMNIQGEHFVESIGQIMEKPNWIFHYYGKTELALDKSMGHIAVLTRDIKRTLKEIEDTQIWI